jgi:hypothetical protein
MPWPELAAVQSGPDLDIDRTWDFHVSGLKVEGLLSTVMPL